ncbi:MAG: 5-methyltetrahydropteroyltriglutamate--homocysteine S-methyltransferase [Alphaproteobacteria bacterium]
MTARAKSPFRADHVGSLLRPARLAEARARGKAGEISADAVRAVEDDCVADAVALQEGLGLHGVTDGEFRRDWWHLDFLWGFAGVEPWEALRAQSFSNDEQPPMAKIVGKVGHPHGIFTDMFGYLAKTTRETAKQTIPGPAMIHLRPGREAVEQSAYPDMDAFWADWTAAYRAEVQSLYDAGCRYLQVDDTSFAYLCDEAMRASMRDRGDDPDDLAALYTSVLNDAIRDRPADMTVTVHTCRGNFKSSWVAQGGYEPVAETVFGGLDVDGIFMEFDSDRAGGFEPLRYVPDGQTVVLGLITTKTPALEDADAVRRRIDEASAYVPLENLCLSPQCGFSSTHHGNAITEDDQKRKLALVVEIADAVWGNA